MPNLWVTYKTPPSYFTNNTKKTVFRHRKFSHLSLMATFLIDKAGLTLMRMSKLDRWSIKECNATDVSWADINRETSFGIRPLGETQLQYIDPFISSNFSTARPRFRCILHFEITECIPNISTLSFRRRRERCNLLGYSFRHNSYTRIRRRS